MLIYLFQVMHFGGFAWADDKDSYYQLKALMSVLSIRHSRVRASDGSVKKSPTSSCAGARKHNPAFRSVNYLETINLLYEITPDEVVKPKIYCPWGTSAISILRVSCKLLPFPVMVRMVCPIRFLKVSV